MPPDLLYDLANKQLRDEKARGIFVSTSMQAAYRFARHRQQKVAASNASRRNKNRKHVGFSEGDVVIQFDPSSDKEVPHKYQFRFGQPMVVVRKHPENPKRVLRQEH